MTGAALKRIAESLRAVGRGPSDAELLDRFRRERHDDAFAALVRRHGRAVLAACRQVLSDPADVDDAFQATFLVLLRKVGSVQAATVRSWLYAVAHRVAVRARADGRRRAEREGRAAQRRRTESDPPDPSWPEAVAILHEELDRLPDAYRRVLLLCYLKGQSREEAAAALGWSPGAVKGHLERGRKMLAGRLARRGIGLSAGLLAVVTGNSAWAGAPPPELIERTVTALAGGGLSMAYVGKKTVACLVAAVGLAAVIGFSLWQARPVAAPKAAVNELDGEWVVVESYHGGRKCPTFKVRAASWRYTFKDGQVEQTYPNGEGGLPKGTTFRLDSTRSPKWIDMTAHVPDEGKRMTVHGVYAVEGDRLRLNMSWQDGGPRPARLEDGAQLLVRPGPREAEPADELGSVLREWSRAEKAYWKAWNEDRPEAEAARVAWQGMAGPLAERCVKVAEDDEGLTGLAALFWAACIAPESAAGKKGLALLEGGRVAQAGLDDVFDALEEQHESGGRDVSERLGRLLLERVKRELDHPRAAWLLSRVAILPWGHDYDEVPAYFTEAADLIVQRFAGSSETYRLCEVLKGGGHLAPAWAARYEPHLRAVLKANEHRHVRAFARLALARVIQLSGEARQAEAVAEYERFVKEFDGTDPVWGSEKSMRFQAERELEVLRKTGLGMKAPEIDGVDLDGKPMKLSDYKGKVVLLSFWGTWCAPCMRLMAHERELVERYQGRPFAVVGVNSDPLTTDLRPAVEKHRITWRSFKDKQPGKPRIDGEYGVSGWPTLYLIDHDGVIRGRWPGTPNEKALDQEIERVVRTAEGKP